MQPGSKVCGERIEVEIQAIAGKGWNIPRSEDVGDSVNQCVCGGLGAWTELSGGDQFGFGIESQPEPDLVTFVAEGSTEFIQLNV